MVAIGLTRTKAVLWISAKHVSNKLGTRERCTGSGFSDGLVILAWVSSLVRFVRSNRYCRDQIDVFLRIAIPVYASISSLSPIGVHLVLREATVLNGRVSELLLLY